MPTFQFDALTSSGLRQTGEVIASSRAAAAAQLQGRGLIVTKVEAVGDKSMSETAALFYWPARPRAVDIELNLHQLAIMLRNGTTLLAAITALSESGSIATRRVWTDISNYIQSGNNLSSSLQRHSCFPKFVSQLVGVGEKTGRLDPVLLRGAVDEEPPNGAFRSFYGGILSDPGGDHGRGGDDVHGDLPDSETRAISA